MTARRSAGWDLKTIAIIVGMVVTLSTGGGMVIANLFGFQTKAEAKADMVDHETAIEKRLDAMHEDIGEIRRGQDRIWDHLVRDQ